MQVTVELGTTYQYERSKAKRLPIEKPDTFQYIPQIDNLQWVLPLIVEGGKGLETGARDTIHYTLRGISLLM